jgi:hypothetical protein
MCIYISRESGYTGYIVYNQQLKWLHNGLQIFKSGYNPGNQRFKWLHYRYRSLKCLRQAQLPISRLWFFVGWHSFESFKLIYMSTSPKKAKQGAESELVLTPGGLRPKAMVHHLKLGHHISGKGGRLRVIETATGKVIKDFGPRSKENRLARSPSAKRSNIIPGTSDHGWIEYSQWTNNTGQPIVFFSTKWVVPPPPASDNNQTIFLYNGLMQGANGNNILQPVLQWGFSGGGGGKFWSILNWFVEGQVAMPMNPDAIQVNPGDVLQGVMAMTSQSGSEFSYTASFVGFPSLTVAATDIDEMTYACETLECYNGNYVTPLAECSDYPDTQYTEMFDIEIRTGTPGSNGTDAAIDWSPVTKFSDCGQGCVIGSNASPGGIVYLNYRTAWGPSTQYDTGGPNSVALDQGNVVEVHVGSGQLYYRVGNADFANQTIAWGPSTHYDSGGPNAVAIDNNGHAVEVHVGSGNLYYHVGNVNYASQTIAWGPSIHYDSGGPNSVAMDNNGHVVEVHVGSGKLYYRVGNINFANQTIAWGPSTQYDTGGPNSVAMDNNGHVVEVHVGSGNLYCRVGNVNFANQTIAWGPSTQYDTGGPNSVSLDDDGHAVEVHVGSGKLYYHVGNVNFASQTINWGPSLQYDTGGPNAVALNYHRNAVEVHVGSGRLFCRVASLSDLEK